MSAFKISPNPLIDRIPASGDEIPANRNAGSFRGQIKP